MDCKLTIYSHTGIRIISNEQTLRQNLDGNKKKMEGWIHYCGTVRTGAIKHACQEGQTDSLGNLKIQDTIMANVNQMDEHVEWK